MRIVVINLLYRTDRRREIEAELQRARFPSVDFFAAIRPSDRLPFGSIGERGAFLSHKSVLAAAEGSSGILVLEDDAAFHVSFDVIARQISELPDYWDVYYGGYGGADFSDRQSECNKGFLPVDPTVELTGTHCYAINGPTVKKISVALQTFLDRPRGHPDGGPMPFDGALNVARRQMQLNTFVAVPPVAHQRASRTDIAPLRWFDRLPVVRDVVAVLRRVKNAAGWKR